MLIPKSKKKQPYITSINEALSVERQVQFQEFMKEDIKALVSRGTWKKLNKFEFSKEDKAIMVTSALNIYRNTSGEFNSFKYRFLC